MREIFYAYTDTEMFADYGTQTEIARDDTRFDKIQEMFANEDLIRIIHSHPIGNLEPSNVDIDTLKGWCFTLGKDIDMILVSGIEWTRWLACFGTFDKKIIIIKAEYKEPNERELELIIKAITESDYVPHLFGRPGDSWFTNRYEFTPGEPPYLVDRD